ncbi:hypothetical protein BOX15_Mlig016601g2 [Macrostomum lignano]|nr:hypothetical protein BOX15_Mlig016601g1 [Macrostomum lignano]PAA76559.1 hypothetical protein BOX15_Mlig016601g2 [Macrostomum lignano]
MQQSSINQLEHSKQQSQSCFSQKKIPDPTENLFDNLQQQFSCQHQMQQSYNFAVPASNACNSSMQYQQQQQQQQQPHSQQIYNVPDSSCLTSAITAAPVVVGPIVANAMPIKETTANASTGSAFGEKQPAVEPETTVRRTVYVPQNWTSVISFVHGNDMEAVMRQCQVDITVSCCSVECSKREKDTLGTARKRAVHICAKRSKDITAAINELMVSMPVLMSQPDLPERSWLSSAAPDTTSDRDQEPSNPQPTQPLMSSQNVGPEASAASGDFCGIDGAVGNSAESMTAEQPYATDSFGGSAMSRRQLNEARPLTLEVDVENSSSGLLPFFPGSCDRRGAVVSARSGCSIEITDRIRRRPNGEERRVIRVQAPNMSALEKCAQLLDLHFPSMGARARFREWRERTDLQAKQLRFG